MSLQSIYLRLVDERLSWQWFDHMTVTHPRASRAQRCLTPVFKLGPSAAQPCDQKRSLNVSLSLEFIFSLENRRQFRTKNPLCQINGYLLRIFETTKNDLYSSSRAATCEFVLAQFILYYLTTEAGWGQSAMTSYEFRENYNASERNVLFRLRTDRMLNANARSEVFVAQHFV